MKANFIDDVVAYEKHMNGECDDDCSYCAFENDLNDEYSFEDGRNNKIAKVGKFEKALKKIW